MPQQRLPGTVDPGTATDSPGTAASPHRHSAANTEVATAPAPEKRLELPALHGRRPHIQVLVPYQVLLGSNDPCELAGHGAITADQARTITADGILQRLLYDPTTGIVLDYGRTRYQPPETLRQLIITRDQTCRTPGCLQPAERCDIDHIEPFRPGKPTGGQTRHTNLDSKCRHHHRAKDGGGFLNTRDPNGTTHWETPLGRKYTMPPPHITDHATTDHDTEDFADRFPPELRKTTDVHRQSGDRSAGELRRTSPTGASQHRTATERPEDDSNNIAPFEEEPPF